MLGLKRGTVALSPHCEMWVETAKETIKLIKGILGKEALDIQHIGSTAIRGICAKPIIDIVVGARDKKDILPYAHALGEAGVIFRKEDERELLFVMGNLEDDFITHHIHVIEWDCDEWKNYINFRDYLRAFPEKARTYESLKKQLAVEFSGDRTTYTAGKKDLIDVLLKEARLWRDNQ